MRSRTECCMIGLLMDASSTPSQTVTVSKRASLGAAARQAAERAKAIKLSQHQRRAVDNGANALLGTGINLCLAGIAGFVAGGWHPLAPAVMYSVLAAGLGIGIADENPSVGNLLVAGGMIVGGTLVMKGAVSIATGVSINDVPGDAMTVANRVAQHVAATPSPTPTASRSAPV